MAELKPNARAVFDYVKAHSEEKITAMDIAEACNLDVRSVNGIITSAFQKKGLMVRIPGERRLPDGMHKAVKWVELTPAGEAFNPDSQE